MSTAVAPIAPSVAPAPPAARVTFDEFQKLYAGAYVEVIDGEVRELAMPQPFHGEVCTNVAIHMGQFVKQNKLGSFCVNDTFVLIRREPLRVRGADAVFWSAAKVPGGTPRTGMIEAVPDLCLEVVSPTNTWSEVFTKVGEYLGIGVPVVVVLAPDSLTASVYRNQPGQMQQIFTSTDTLTVPDVLPGFAVPVARFFE